MGDADREFISAMIQEFIRVVPAYIDELKKSISNNDSKGVHFFAHKLKSSVDILGAQKLSNASLEIANLFADTNQLPDQLAISKLNSLELIFEETKKELFSELATINPINN
jgi:HPt (histidine-containing phosphotransfer) domain-containing protein